MLEIEYEDDYKTYATIKINGIILWKGSLIGNSKIDNDRILLLQGSHVIYECYVVKGGVVLFGQETFTVTIEIFKNLLQELYCNDLINLLNYDSNSNIKIIKKIFKNLKFNGVPTILIQSENDFVKIKVTDIIYEEKSNIIFSELFFIDEFGNVEEKKGSLVKEFCILNMKIGIIKLVIQSII